MTVTPGDPVQSTVLRLAAVDDHEIVLRGLLGLASGPTADPQTDQSAGLKLELVALARSVAELLATIHACGRIDVVLLDLHLDDGSAPADNVAALMRAEVPVVLFTSDLRPVPIRKAMRAGARGLVLKSDGVQSLLDTLKDVHELGHGFSSDLAHVLMTDPDLAPELARREVEALSLLASGIPRKVVHKYMQPPVSQHTVDTYFKRIADRYANVGRALNSAFHAAHEASRDGHVDLAPVTPSRSPSAD